MNGKQSKKANVRAKEIIMEWLISVVPEEEAYKINKKNFNSFLPEDKYFIAKRSKWISFYTVRWAKKNIKKLMNKGYDVSSITLKDIEWSEK
jgi:hypothetical protein|tara:strand:- start:1655 stop:1930 length:276 start_codon:yes stop_codon:yes gene_type:complete